MSAPLVTPASDPLDGAPIRCTVEMGSDGTVTLVRSAGCTPLDAYDLCVLVARGTGYIDGTGRRDHRGTD